jgi:hypothetical protein
MAPRRATGKPGEVGIRVAADTVTGDPACRAYARRSQAEIRQSRVMAQWTGQPSRILIHRRA